MSPAQRGLENFFANATEGDDGPPTLAGIPVIPVPVVAQRTADETRAALAAALTAARPKAARRRKAAAEPVPAGEVAQAAWQLVEAAHYSARDFPREWVGFSIRLPRSLADQLGDRVRKDRRRTGNRHLAKRHYLSAALSLIPADPVLAAALGREWRQANRGVTGDAVAGNGLHAGVAQAMTDLASELGDPRLAVRAWEVQAAAVTALLGQLEEPSAPAAGQAQESMG